MHKEVGDGNVSCSGSIIRSGAILALRLNELIVLFGKDNRQSFFCGYEFSKETSHLEMATMEWSKILCFVDETKSRC